MLRFAASKNGFERNPGRWMMRIERDASPPWAVRSILITSAPQSARIIAAAGTNVCSATSTTFTPCITSYTSFPLVPILTVVSGERTILRPWDRHRRSSSSTAVVTKQPVDRSAMPDLPTTWVLTVRDHSLRAPLQREFNANLGNVDEVVEIDTCHNVMLSEPDELASVLLSRA